MKVEFKYANLDDLSRIVSTYNESIPSRMATADLEPVSVESKVDWFNSHNKSVRPIWLVFADDNYAGWMSFSDFYGRPAYSGTAELSIYLDEKFHGLGLGAKCLAYAISIAPSCDIHTLLGFIFDHNTPSLNLFYKFGFEKWAHLPQVANMDGVMRDLLILGKKLF